MRDILRHKYLAVFCLFCALPPFMSVVVPHGLAFVPSAIATILYGLYYFTFQEKPAFSKKTFWLVLVIFVMAAVSLLAASYFEVTYKKVSKLVLLLPLQLCLMSLVHTLDKEKLKNITIFIPIGFVAGSLLLCFEIITGGVLFNLIRGEGGSVPADPDEFNRGAIIISLCSFSVLAMLKMRLSHAFIPYLLLVPLLVALMLSESQSAQISFIVGLLFLFAFPYQSKWAWRGLKYSVLACMLTAPFWIGYVYQHFVNEIQDMPMMANAYAGYRLELWTSLSHYISDQPFWGHGVSVTRALTEFESQQLFFKDDNVLHPHNFIFQIWIEMGLIGMLGAMAFVYMLFTSVEKNYTQAQQRIILPTIMATMVPASAAFGIWQSWWMASLFYLAALCLIACKFVSDDN